MKKIIVFAFALAFAALPAAASNDSCGCTGKSSGRGERGDQGGQKADQIKIDQNAKSVNAKIDQTEGYAEFICKIQAVARAGKQLFVIAEAFSVTQEA